MGQIELLRQGARQACQAKQPPFKRYRSVDTGSGIHGHLPAAERWLQPAGETGGDERAWEKSAAKTYDDLFILPGDVQFRPARELANVHHPAVLAPEMEDYLARRTLHANGAQPGRPYGLQKRNRADHRHNGEHVAAAQLEIAPRIDHFGRARVVRTTADRPLPYTPDVKSGTSQIKPFTCRCLRL